MTIEIVKPKVSYSETGATAGFPSPASDYLEAPLDLNEYLVARPTSTFFVRATGESAPDASIEHGDLLIVDKSLDPVHSNIIIAVLEGEFAVMRFLCDADGARLVSVGSARKPIELTDDSHIEIWGVVTYVIHRAR